MPERLMLTQNAQFYKIITPITDEFVEELLNIASSNIQDGADYFLNALRSSRTTTTTNTSYKVSFRVYPSKRKVYFIDEELNDIIYAYILMLEFDDYVGILSKSCESYSDYIEEYLEQVAQQKLNATFSDEDVEFEKVVLRNMTVSERALKTRSYEASDLKGLLSTHSAGRSIPQYLKIKQNGHSKAITGNSGRIVESSVRKGLDEVSEWVKSQIDLIKQPFIDKSFLSKFAKRVELCEVLACSRPSAILIEKVRIVDGLINEEIELRYKTRKGKLLKVSDRVQTQLFEALEKVFEFDNVGFIHNETSIVGRLRENKATLTFDSNVLRSFRIVEDGEEITLQKYIIKNKLYSITFTNPKYMYFMGNCFEDTSGISEADALIQILEVLPQLSNALSEKGVINAASTVFDLDSVFGIVENEYANDDYVFCDDLGNEWADHIILNQTTSTISFVHSKHADASVSASKMHDVVGQGIKNLGNMFFQTKDLQHKCLNKFNQPYSSSQISRVRKGNLAQIDQCVESITGNYRALRKSVLCCSFLSRSEVKLQFEKIKMGQPVSGNVIQLFWIISSFAHAAKETGVQPVIYCQP